MSSSSLNGLVRSGHIAESLRLVRENNGRDPEAQILFAELLYHSGEAVQAEHLADRIPVHTPTLSQSARARLDMVKSSCRCDAGDYQGALEASCHALVHAQSSKDLTVAALASAQLLERSGGDIWNANVPLANQARNYTLRAGDAQLTARVHLVFGRLEGRAGHYETAIRHFSVARSVLAGGAERMD